MKRFGLLGFPVAHSLSPGLLQRFFRTFGLSHSYEALALEPRALGERWEALRDQYAGFHVTAPHKQTLLSLVATLDPAAARCGALNLLLRRPDGSWKGYNTDGAAYVTSLLEAHGQAIHHHGVLVVGAGGAAHAVSYALVAAGAQGLYVTNRTAAKAEHLAARCGGQAVAWGQLRTILPQVKLVIQTTPVGWDDASAPFPGAWLTTAHVASDLIYRSTPWLRAAAAAGARAQDGLGMFVQQLHQSLRLWDQPEVPVATLQRWAQEALQERRR